MKLCLKEWYTMNKNGQTLILFVLLLPVLIVLLAFVVDTGIVLQEKTRVNSLVKTILKTTHEEYLEENYQEKVLDLLNKNNIPVEKFDLKITVEEIKIQIEYQKESIFGKIIGISNYKIKSSIKGKIKEGTLKIEKE